MAKLTKEGFEHQRKSLNDMTKRKRKFDVFLVFDKFYEPNDLEKNRTQILSAFVNRTDRE